jgi:Domain of unknown function (DUF6983)
MMTIPLRPVANQTLQVQIEDQPCEIVLVQTAYGLFMSLSVDGVLIIAGAPCQNRNRILRSRYLDFTGDFVFVDSEGDKDPSYDGLGTRWQLIWLTDEEVTELLAVVVA